MPDEDPVGSVDDDNAVAAHVRDQGFGGGHDQFLQPVQEHRAVAEEEEPAFGAGEGGSAEQEG